MSKEEMLLKEKKIILKTYFINRVQVYFGLFVENLKRLKLSLVATDQINQ